MWESTKALNGTELGADATGPAHFILVDVMSLFHETRALVFRHARSLAGLIHTLIKLETIDTTFIFFCIKLGTGHWSNLTY